jgi:photosystem II stability/assembly factor-like uncharacterized protein
VDDVNLRLEFHRALDPLAPAAPWLAPRVREALRRERGASWIHRIRRRSADLRWLLPLVAVLLAGAIIASLVYGAHALRFSIPVFPLQHQAPAAASNCPTWGYIPGGGNAPTSIKMTSLTVGWAPGDLRTTDGGAHWHDVSPPVLRSDAPYLPGQQTAYPPGYADFFLDSDHAWLVRSYAKSTWCVDHLTVFSTSDGGHTWRRSSDIPASFTRDQNLVLYFLDTLRGWLFVPGDVGGGRLYATENGGQDWKVASNAAPMCAAMFSSPTTGWSTCDSANSGSSTAGLQVTRDAGATWNWKELPNPPHGCGCSTTLPVFFDPMHGAVQDYGNSGQDVFVTSDGGLTWTALPSVPAQGPGWVSIDFEDAGDFWLVGGGGKGGPPLNSLFHSSDGGHSWQLVQKDIPVGFGLGPGGAQVQFLDPMHGFVLQSPQLFVTADGGHTWTVMQVQIS